MGKFYNYKGFKVEEFDAIYPPEIPGKKVYKFCLPYTMVCRMSGLPEIDDYFKGGLSPMDIKSIFDDDVKGIDPTEDLPALDLSYWPIKEYMPFGLNPADIKDDTPYYHLKYRMFYRSSHVFESGGKFGVMDEHENIIIAPVWDEVKALHQVVDSFGMRTFYAARRGQKWGFARGVYVTEQVYDSIEYLGDYNTRHKGYQLCHFLVKKEGLLGISDESFEVVPCGSIPSDASFEFCDALMKGMVASQINLPDNPYFNQAMQYIKDNDLSRMTPREIKLAGSNLTMTILDKIPGEKADARLEAHSRHIDLVVPITSDEVYALKPKSLCQNPVQTDVEHDVTYYGDKVETTITVKAGQPLVLTPEMAHTAMDCSSPLRKAIFKIFVM